MDLVITRLFDAPRDMVYQAFVDPKQFTAWFGPVGWSVPSESVDFDVRIGGHQRFTMVNDDDPSMTSPANGTFVEIVENELLVGEEVDPQSGLTLSLRLEFSDADGKTKLVLRQGPFSDEIAGQAREGWGSSFTKLDALLAD